MAKIQFSFCVCFWLFVLLFLHYVQDHNPIPDWNQFNKDPAVKRAHHSLYPIMQIKPKLAHSNYIFNTHSFIKNNIHELAGYVHFSFFLSFLSELYKNIFSFSSQLFAVFWIQFVPIHFVFLRKIYQHLPCRGGKRLVIRCKKDIWIWTASRRRKELLCGT